MASKYKKNKTLLIIIIVILIAGLGLGAYFAFTNLNKTSSSAGTSSSVEESKSQSHSEHSSNPIIEGGIQFHFLELGNKYTGDCTFIKAGETDILIDAGSRNSSASTITNYINKYCTDGKLEYVIATHAHQDHIAGFVGTGSIPGIFDTYKIGTLIDFSGHKTTSEIYNNYISKRDACIASKSIGNHFTALECAKETNGAQKTYSLAQGITLNILYQKYYDNTTSDENNYSVCTLFKQNDTSYLLTGDLEKEGEKSLVENNTLPKCQLFKGGHHGSYTANTDTLLSVIQPKVVCICCCAGSTEYTDNPNNTFPAQDSINRLAKYTSEIYVTTVSNTTEKGYESLNGNIVFISSGISYNINCSNNNTILKESNWFKANRTWPQI